MPRPRSSASWGQARHDLVGSDMTDVGPVLSEPVAKVSKGRMSKRIRIAIGAVVIVVLATSAWLWATAGRETTDDAQVDAHVAPVAARVGGTVTEVPVKDNQQVEAGAVLVAIDPRDYQVALDKARAELATAEADAAAARVNVPITSTTATSNVSTAQGGVEQAQAAIDAAQRGVEGAAARVATAQA